jgi:glutathione S-transferase
MIKLYTFPSFVSLKPVIVAEEMGLSYEVVALDAASGAHKQPEHLKRHPLGKTPVLEQDGKFLFESNAICRYLAAMNRSSLYPEGVWERGQVEQWIDYVTLQPGKWMTTVMYEEYLRPRYYGTTPNPAVIEEAKKFLPEQLSVLEDALGRTMFLAGNQYTLADVVCFSHVATTEVSSVKLTDYPRLERWFQSVKNREPVRRAMQKINMV